MTRAALWLIGAAMAATCAVASAADEQTAAVTCVVIDAKTNKPVPNHRVTVKHFDLASVDKQYDLTTDAKGEVVAKDVPCGATRSIGFDTQWEGKVVKVRQIPLLGPPPAPLRLVVGGAQPAMAHGAEGHGGAPMAAPPPLPTELAIRSCQLSVGVGEQQLYFNELVEIGVPASRARKPLLIPLPEDASHLQLGGKLRDVRMRITSDGVELRDGLEAGDRRVQISYSMPYYDASLSIVRHLTAPIGIMAVTIENPDVRLVSSDLRPVEMGEEAAAHLTVYEAGNLRPDQIVTFELQGLPYWPGRAHGFTATAASLAAALAVVVYMLTKSYRPLPETGPEAKLFAIDEQRSRLMVQIAETDAALGRTPGDKALESKRSSLMGQLRKLTEQLRQALSS